MRFQNLLAISGIFVLGNVGHSLARLDESDVPAQCHDICEPVVQASQKCDRDVPDRETRMECKCTWIHLKKSGTVSNCNRCMHGRHDGDWNKRDGDDGDDSDSDDDEGDDGNDMYQFCQTAATGTPVTTTMTTSSATSTMTTTMTMQPSATSMGYESSATSMGYESSDTTGSSPSPTSSSSGSTRNGADSLPMSASLAAIAGLAFFPWL
ncbi:hypothetical protein N7475_009998 [Penicillium sp. IBT 31633x]|nr:hypothetical protein N7475_009998 [Penicillium sp. IBT 31633x]